ncbi:MULTISPECIES: UDP-N-acetylmuramoyl-tripeptide--D-alanyl-D-alanine ligase [unclassified Legionella]|uniref:UDP-N-acetylmuramoyl-tripeptide--D-alanyl-D- alanine ligase n=1 Tax=unclassified Legionella TaxID=2622702 RepID=UPI001055852C|nr:MULTISPECIES: UDP-N-acetylmuramoyl-tripeptide--D-alanyl-D-alanine ligase [unclassified Legionella]MDI9819210.1 UDP-N-acetylmuramoyl-tripeptide--D-alanyl-D-alanine ligase [Legionella sp. PL877]
MNLTQIASVLNSSCDSNAVITGVTIDSRQVKSGDLFIAVKGERFDGHDFIEEAAAKGAIAVVCTQASRPVSIPQFIVKDTLKALAQIAAWHRQTITCPVIALTGSNGKTTVKDMIASILPKPAHATLGNLNNHIGVPLSVLQLKTEHRYAVFELGANHIGEIAYTAGLVKPDIALINNIAPAHIGEFGSIEGVARAKGEIYAATVGTVVVNEDDDYAHFWDEMLGDKQVLRFSLTKTADVYAKNIAYDERGCAHFEMVLPLGEARVMMQVPGEHTMRNALAAACCCYAAGIGLADIVSGLNQFRGVAGRMTFLDGKNNSLVIDDTYNANLHSVLVAVDILARRQGRRILVLGDMGELGSWTREHHEQVGHVALHQGVDLLLTYGVDSEYASNIFGENARHYNNQEALVRDLLLTLDADTTVLVKGSRASKMEKIVHQLIG